jgi:hypothetical protein
MNLLGVVEPLPVICMLMPAALLTEVSKTLLVLEVAGSLTAMPELTVTPTPLVGVNVQLPIIVGDMACDSAGAPSDRMNVVAEPATAARPTVPVGVAPTGRPAGCTAVAAKAMLATCAVDKLSVGAVAVPATARLELETDVTGAVPLDTPVTMPLLFTVILAYV